MTACASCGQEFEPAHSGQGLCPQCAQPAPLPPAEPRPSRFRQLLSSPTLLLIAANVLIFLLMAIQGREVMDFDGRLLLRWGANSGGLTPAGDWWRLLTSAFEHGGLVHIALNMWCLFNLGWLAELLFGRARFTLLYFLCAIGGSLGSILWRGNGLSVGASGAIFGVAGALIPAMLLHGNPQLRALLKGQLVSIAFFVFYNLAFGAAVSGTDNAAHVGGLVTGLLLGVAFPTGYVNGRRAGRWRVAAATVLLLVGFCGLGAWARQRDAAYVESARADSARQRGDLAGATNHAARAVALNPQDYHLRFNLGALHLAQKHWSEAADAFAASTRLDPKSGPAFVDLCVAQRELRQYNQALASCEQGTLLAPDAPESWFSLGRVRYDLHDLKGARDALAKAVALNPGGFDENLQYALLLIANREEGKALPYLHKAHDLHPEDGGVTRMLFSLEH